MTAQSQSVSKPALQLGEFVALLGLVTSLVALSIDAMLPALSAIGDDLGVVEANDNQWVLSSVFLGLAIGQIFYGPVSDSVGRKPAIYAGLLLFMMGCVLSLVATSFTTMLAGRFLQGLGAAGPRIVTMALVRDLYQGSSMARIMSFVMTVFILVPVFAPALGQALLLVAHWRAIFASFLLLALIAFAWFALRQPETLAIERRVKFSLRTIGKGVVETCRNRTAFGYTITAGLIFGAFIGFLISVQQILQIQYELGVQFPIYFAILAAALGCASFVNAKLVVRLGMRHLCWIALILLSCFAVVFLLIAYLLAGHPPLWSLMIYLLVSFFCLGVLFGNFNALAMEPLGHIAGVAAAVIASLTTFMSLTLGTLIGQSYNGTILPLVGGFACLSIAALLVMRWIEKKGVEHGG